MSRKSRDAGAPRPDRAEGGNSGGPGEAESEWPAGPAKGKGKGKRETPIGAQLSCLACGARFDTPQQLNEHVGKGHRPSMAMGR